MKQRDRGPSRRERIVAAVASVAGREGVAALSAARVAAEAGCAKATVLYHFGELHVLWQAGTEAALAPWWAAQAEALAAPGDPRAALDAWLAASFGGRSSALRLRAQLAGAPPDLPAAATLIAAERELEVALERLLERGHREHCWRSARPSVDATILRGLVDGLLVAALQAGDDAALPACHAVCRSAALDLLLRGG
ncbi:MAG: hypothetical protein RIT45_2843 [Pseudomonadota bacterium]|jgi:AcrR family transcriptional regulator